MRTGRLPCPECGKPEGELRGTRGRWGEAVEEERVCKSCGHLWFPVVPWEEVHPPVAEDGIVSKLRKRLTI